MSRLLVERPAAFDSVQHRGDRRLRDVMRARGHAGPLVRARGRRASATTPSWSTSGSRASSSGARTRSGRTSRRARPPAADRPRATAREIARGRRRHGLPQGRRARRARNRTSSTATRLTGADAGALRRTSSCGCGRGPRRLRGDAHAPPAARPCPGWTFSVEPLSDDARASQPAPPASCRSLPAALVAAFLLLMVALGLIGRPLAERARRTREIGLRRATGATARGVVLQVARGAPRGDDVGVLLGASCSCVQLPLLGARLRSATASTRPRWPWRRSPRSTA